VKYVDETGWCINGRNHWLCAFISEKEKIALYKIDRSRSSEVPRKVLGKKPNGITGSDFYSSYDKFGGKQQKPWVHLLRETSKLVRKKNSSEEMKQFHKIIKRLYQEDPDCDFFCNDNVDGIVLLQLLVIQLAYTERKKLIKSPKKTGERNKQLLLYHLT